MIFSYMSPYQPRLSIRTLTIFFILFIPELIFSQVQKGRVLSSETNSGIGYVNIGIIGKNIGTVSDGAGNFTITLDTVYNADSLRFSMIGYKSETFLISNFRDDSIRNIYLDPKIYDLQEVVINVIHRKTKEIRIGKPVTSDYLKSGFSENTLGSELGIKVNVRERVILKDINLNVAICTFDSVTYRLNIYQSTDQAEFKNILTGPIYISFSKDKINNVLTFDLSKYSIIIEGNVLITLELYKDLGEGRLLFRTEFFTGSTYHRKTSQGTWTAASGLIGMYLHGQLLR